MPLLVCPNCHVEMAEVNHQGVELDVCTNCQGIWLDKGELEKIVGMAQHVRNDKEFWGSFLDSFQK